MFKLIALFYDLEDPDAFVQYHREVLEPKLLAFPGVTKLEITRISPQSPFSDLPNPCFLMSEMYLASQEALEHTITSKEGMEFARIFLENAADFSTVFVGNYNTYYSNQYE